MTFLYPGFLWALFVLAIPVLIHLFNLRRYRKKPFTNVRFLKELQKQTRSFRTLRQYLVLAARMLALAFLVLAFAQPYIPVEGGHVKPGSNVVIIYIDNSFSMEAESERGPSLEVAKIRADEIIKNYMETDRFCIITNDFTGSVRLINKDQALMRAGEVEKGPESRDLDEILKRIGTVRAGYPDERNTDIFLLSDFQFVTGQEPVHLADTSSNYFLLPIRARAVRNISIDSVYLEDPMVKLNEPVHLMVDLSNHGEEDRNGINLALRINGELKATTSLDITAAARTKTGFDFVITEGGWKQAMLELTDDPIVFDDVFYFTFPVKENVKILNVFGQEANRDLARVFANDPYYRYEAVPATAIDYAAMGKYDLIILDHLPSLSSGLIKVIEDYTVSGGAVVIFPTQEGTGDLNTLARATGASQYEGESTGNVDVARILFDHDLFDNVFEKVNTNMNLPSLNKYYRMRAGRGSETLMTLRNNQPFLTSTNHGGGKIYQFAIPLDRAFSNLADHAIFVPVILKMSLQSSIRYPLWYTIGEMKPIRVDDRVEPTETGLRLEKEQYSIVPERIPGRNETLISENGQVTDAGNYALKKEENTVQSIAFNYSRKESITDLPGTEELRNVLQQDNIRILDAIRNDIARQLKNEELGRKFWKECLLLSLFFILIEILLLRLWPLRVKAIPK